MTLPYKEFFDILILILIYLMINFKKIALECEQSVNI